MSKEKQILDTFETTFSSYEEMHDYHHENTQNSIWRKAKIGSFNAFPLVRDSDGEIKNGLMCNPDQVSKEAIDDTADNTRIGLRLKLLPEYNGEGLFTETVYEEEIVYIPLRDAAVRSMLDRAKISGFSLQKLSPLDLCFVLNKCFELYPDSESIVLIRDEKITACHSDGYAVLPVDELLDALVTSLEENFGVVDFTKGYTSHSFVTADFSLKHATNMLKSYTDKLKKMGRTAMADNLVPAVKFSSSDTGVSAARCTAYLTGNGAPIAIGSALEVEHKGKASVASFGTKVDQLFAQFDKSLAKLEKLMDIDIIYPISCMERVCRYLKLPKKASLEAVSQFEMTNGDEPCTAHDIYLALQEVPYLYRTGSDVKVSQLTVFNYEENVARALSIDWKQHDVMKRVSW